MTHHRRVFVFVSLSLLFFAIGAAAQPSATDLLLPSKLTFTPRGHVLVAENGTGPNLGRISVIDRNTNEQRTLIGGLPAGINTAEGEPSPSGPSGVFISGNTLYVTIGQGDAVLAGAAPGTQIPNPSPASPLLSSVLEFVPNKPIDDIPGGLVLTPDQQLQIRSGGIVTLGNGQNFFSVRLVADFENFRAEPRPDFPANVRASNPYGLTMIGDTIYVADAGWNAVRSVRPSDHSRTVTTLTTFPPLQNPTPVGAPVIDAVPDSIRADGNRLLVTLLTGFPFVPGLSRAVSIDPSTGVATTIVGDLSSAIDIIPVGSGYLISEFSTNLMSGAPGRITMVLNDATRFTVIDNFISPSSLALDKRTGELFIASIFRGIVERADITTDLPEFDPESIVPVVGSVAGAFGSRFETALQLTNPHPFAVSGVLTIRGDETRRVAYQLSAYETGSYANLMADAGAEGIATMDIEPAVGEAPVAVTRIFDTSHSTMSTGTVVAQLTPDDALHAGEHSAVIASADPTRARTNVGVRALAEGALVRLTLHRSNGVTAASVEVPVGQNRLRQESIAGWFDTTAAANDSIVVEVLQGAAIVYASIVNDATQETSFQAARRDRD